MKRNIYNSTGYALPMIIILSTALLVLGLTILQSADASRQALSNQYYTRLAKEAGQAGVAMAQDCLAQNANTAQWTSASPLKPRTDCSGTSICGSPCNQLQQYLVNTSRVRTYFSVSPPDSSRRMTSTGYTELTRSDGTVYRTYTQTVTSPVPVSVVTLAYTGELWQDYMLRADGSLWGWGNNSVGQLGDGTTTNHTTPEQIISSGVTQFATGLGSAFAVKSDGSLWAWGQNSNGEVGNSTPEGTHVLSPVQIFSSGVKQVVAQWTNTWVVKTDGSVWSWGQNGDGQIGDGTTTNRTAPVKVISSGVSSLWASNSAGGFITIYALKTNGSLWGWGGNGSAQVTVPANVNGQLTPIQIIASGVAQYGMTASSTGYVIKTDGSLWMWGYNGDSEFGNGTTSFSQPPTQILASGSKRIIPSIYGTTYLIKTNGSLWAWGYNQNGEVGNGTVTSPVTAKYQVISSGVSDVLMDQTTPMTYVTKTDGSLWSWGKNTYGQVGNNTKTARLTPYQTMTGSPAIQDVWISNDGGNPMVLKSDGSLWTWGYNQNGEVGNGTEGSTDSTKTPVLLPYKVISSDVIPYTTTNQYFTPLKAAKDDGSLWAWGLNNNGQVGNGTTADQTTPLQIFAPPYQPPLF